jgi:hypothetical protein
LASDDHRDDDEVQLNSYFEKFANPLGHVILEFNYLEMDAGTMIARLLNQDDMTAATFAGVLSFIEKLKLIQALIVFKVQDRDMRRQFDALVEEATNLNAKRNRYVHAEYMPVVGPTDELVKMLHRRLKDSSEIVDVAKGDNGENVDVAKGSSKGKKGSRKKRKKKSFQDLLQPVDEKDLRKLASNIHNLAYQMRVLAEKFLGDVPLDVEKREAGVAD